MRGGFGKADAGIDDDVRAAYTRLFGCADPLSQLRFHLVHHVAVLGKAGHRLRRAAHVHQHHTAAGLRHHCGRRRIMREARDIIDHRGTRRERGPHRGCIARIDRNIGTVAGERLDQRQHACLFRIRRNRRRAGPRTFAANIQDRCAGFDHCQALCNSGRYTGIGKTVGSCVQDAHDRGRRGVSAAWRHGWPDVPVN